MDQKLFIANWKSHKTPEEVKTFFEEFKSLCGEINFLNKKIIIAPPYPLLGIVMDEIKASNLPISISSQDVSPFEEGAYTGEVAASLLKHYAEFVIIGHSERRENFGENDEILKEKVERALSVNIAPIYCVQNENQKVPQGVEIVAYEPTAAIGTGNPDDPQHVEEVFKTIQNSYPHAKFLYGGSITDDTIERFLALQSLGGFLIGGASLSAQSLISLLKKW